MSTYNQVGVRSQSYYWAIERKSVKGKLRFHQTVALRSSIFAAKKTINFRSIFECLAPVGGCALYVGGPEEKRHATPNTTFLQSK